jgi:spore coat polysaccharide biosynthesis protein SpsF
MAFELPAGFGIVLQARTGSTRLPGKMTRPFFDDKTMLEVIFEGLLSTFDPKHIFLATSTAPADEALVNMAKEYGIGFYTGSEDDVLDRFVQCAKHFGLEVNVRICADNPFIQPQHMKELILDYASDPCDYSSFAFPDGTPIIRSHIGFFTEIVRTAALEKAANATSDSFYHEHVTNYIYGNPDQYHVRLLPLPLHLQARTDIRLTIDTADDFEMASALYGEMMAQKTLHNTEAIVAAIDTKPHYKERMLKLIKQFTK